jgi:Lar family restriction alleviation protein
MKMDAAQMEKRKYCPFCGSKEAALHKIKLEVHLPYRIVCQGCGAAGPWKMSAKEAWEGWGKRYAPWEPRKWRRVENGRYTYEGD